MRVWEDTGTVTRAGTGIKSKIVLVPAVTRNRGLAIFIIYIGYQVKKYQVRVELSFFPKKMISEKFPEIFPEKFPGPGKKWKKI